MKKFFLFLTTVFFVTNQGFCLNSTWTAPLKISSHMSSTNSSAFSIAIDSNSNAIVTWLDGPNPGSSNEIYSAVLPSGALAWDTPELIFSHAAPKFTANPNVATDLNGNQIVVWEEIDSDRNELTLNLTSRPFNSTGWPVPIVTVLPGINASGGTQLGNLGNGLAAMALTPNFSPPFSILWTTIAAGAAAWGSEVILGTDNSAPAIVGSSVDESQAVVIWKTDSPALSLKAVGYLFSNDQTVSLPDVNLPDGTTTVQNVQVNNDSKGNAVAFFTASVDGVIYQAYAAVLVSGASTWTEPVLVSRSGNNANALSVQLADTSATLLWGEFSPQNEGFVFAADLDFQGVLANRTQLAGSIENVVAIDYNSNISLDALGNAAAAWGYSTENSSVIQVATRSASGAWTEITTLSTSGLTPTVALNAQGTAVVVWTANNGDLMSATNLGTSDTTEEIDIVEVVEIFVHQEQ